VSVLALPELASPSARCVVICGRWTDALLVLVVFGKHELEDRGDDEEDSVENGDCEYRLLEHTRQMEVGKVCNILGVAKAKAVLSIAGALGVRRPTAQGGIHVAIAAMRSSPGQDSNCGKSADEAGVQYDRKEGEKADAPEAEGEYDGEEKVEHSGS